jgi:hypothetical protein
MVTTIALTMAALADRRGAARRARPGFTLRRFGFEEILRGGIDRMTLSWVRDPHQAERRKMAAPTPIGSKIIRRKPVTLRGPCRRGFGGLDPT